MSDVLTGNKQSAKKNTGSIQSRAVLADNGSSHNAESAPRSLVKVASAVDSSKSGDTTVLFSQFSFFDGGSVSAPGDPWDDVQLPSRRGMPQQYGKSQYRPN